MELPAGNETNAPPSQRKGLEATATSTVGGKPNGLGARALSSES